MFSTISPSCHGISSVKRTSSKSSIGTPTRILTTLNENTIKMEETRTRGHSKHEFVHQNSCPDKNSLWDKG